MAQAEAKHFIEALEANRKLMEEIRAKVLEAGKPAADAYVEVAKEQGFEFTVEELAAELAAKQASDADALAAAKLDDAELEQVTGGGDYDHVGPERCRDTYMDGEDCSFTDKCLTLVNIYRHKDNCGYTFIPGENCNVLDECNSVVSSYKKS